MFASYPQHAADGSVEAVAVIVMDLSWIGRGASALAERSGSVVLVVDGKGTVIARQPDPDTWVGRQFSDHPLIRKMLERSEGTLTENGIDGMRRVFGFVQLPGTDARLAVGLDENEVLRRVNEAMWRSYIQLGLITLVVLAGIWFGGERLLVKPIRALAWIANRVGRGELETCTAERHWAAEFVPLVAALDDMAGQLTKREHRLRETNDRLQELAQNDGLTGLANRRAFDTRLQTEWQLGMKLGHPIALLMIDIDHFKLLNDNYGHVAGDACLRTLGKVFADAVRKGDLAARYGGEEFALLLPGAELESATRVAQRLQASVEALRIAHAAAPAHHVTVSIGVASFRPRMGASALALVEAADASLYEAKRRGRNAVVAHPVARLAAPKSHRASFLEAGEGSR